MVFVPFHLKENSSKHKVIPIANQMDVLLPKWYAQLSRIGASHLCMIFLWLLLVRIWILWNGKHSEKFPRIFSSRWLFMYVVKHTPSSHLCLSASKGSQSHTQRETCVYTTTPTIHLKSLIYSLKSIESTITSQHIYKQYRSTEDSERWRGERVQELHSKSIYLHIDYDMRIEIRCVYLLLSCQYTVKALSRTNDLFNV